MDWQSGAKNNCLRKRVVEALKAWERSVENRGLLLRYPEREVKSNYEGDNPNSEYFSVAIIIRLEKLWSRATCVSPSHLRR